MAFLCEIKDKYFTTFKLETTLATLDVHDPKVTALVEAILGVHAATPLEKFDVKYVSGPHPSLWSYVLKAKDGRMWTQTMAIDGLGTGMTFDVPDVWLYESELFPQRNLRDAVIAVLPELENLQVRMV